MGNFKQLIANARNSDGYWFGRVKLNAATQLQDLLAASGLNQEQYAEKLGVKPPQVSRVLNGLGNPTLETLVKMGRALGYVPKVSFVPDGARSAGFDSATDTASITLDIQRVDVKPTCRVITMSVHRPVLPRTKSPEIHKHQLGYDSTWPMAA
jgi:transcriptional regulator with XRE-family HTH domain